MGDKRSPRFGPRRTWLATRTTSRARSSTPSGPGLPGRSVCEAVAAVAGVSRSRPW